MPAPAAQPAQREPRAVELLDAAQKALADARSLTYRVEQTMETTDELENPIFASVTFSARGDVRAARDPEGRWVYRIDGTADDLGRPDAFSVSLARSPATVSWLEHTEKSLIVTQSNLARNRIVGLAPQFAVDFLFDRPLNPPYKPIADAPALSVLPGEVINGEACDVILAEHPGDKGQQAFRLYLGTGDALPRRIVRVMIPGLEEHYTFTAIATEPAVEPASLELKAPDGWQTAYRPETLRPGGPAQTPAAPTETGRYADNLPQGVTVGTKVGDAAPPFTGSTLLGEQHSSESVAGRPALLVFWTTWAPNAHAAVKDLPALRADHPDLAIVTFSVRERDPDAPFNMMADAGAEDIPVLTDARESILNYAVTRVPTIVLLDNDGIIRFRADEFSPDTTPALLREAVAALFAEPAGGE
jgi:peroxiredoxin